MPAPINARVETVASGKFFRLIWPHRALVAADGWYEWVKDEADPKRKQPYFIRLRDGGPMFFAAIGQLSPAGSEIREDDGFVIITADAQSGMLDIHDRRPVVLPADLAREWISTRIAQRVKRLPKGKPFCISRFAELGARGAISKAVARLVSQGELERVHRGIYMRPKSSRYVARVRPNVWEVVSLIARQHRHVLQIHGAHAVRLFGLSTQMPLIPIYYTSGPSRSFFMGKAEVRLVHAAPMVMQRAGTEVGTAISALFYLGKDGSTPECIAAIKKVLRPEDLTTLMACKMPKWMRMALELSARIHTVNTLAP